MAIVVEDGSGKADAVAYISVTAADAYFAARGIAAWADADTPAKEAALVRAADYLTQRYRQRWKGARKTATQAMDWPRVICGETVALPVEVMNANAELAVRALSADLSPDLTRADDVIREKVDVIEVEYKPGSRTGTDYNAVAGILTPWLSSSGGVRLVRG